MKIAQTAPDALKILWREQVFFKYKKLNDIKATLEKRGYNFTDYNLSMALKNAKFLTRKGARGDYTYIQKHPFIEEHDNVQRPKNK
jgi:hypothetical protein